MTDIQTEYASNPAIPRSITREMHESYLTYAPSVIHSRALPDVRDGLKRSEERRRGKECRPRGAPYP